MICTPKIDNTSTNDNESSQAESFSEAKSVSEAGDMSRTSLWQGNLFKKLASVAFGLVAVAAVGFMIFGANHGASHDPERRIPDAPQTVRGNGTELLVRAYSVPDPNQARRSQRSLAGTLQPRYQSPLGFRIGGKVITRHVETGDRVVQGQLLMQLDPEDSALQLEVAHSDWIAARSQLAQIEAEESRLRPLMKTGSVSKSEYDLALAARDTARARLDAAERRKKLAENQKSYCELKADQDGLVTAVLGEIGQVVSAGQPVIQWMHGQELEAVVNVPESMQREVGSLDVEITFWSRPGVLLRGKLRELSPIANPQSRTYDARFQILDPPSDLALGMTATVHLLSADSSGIPIPMSAIADREGRPSVWKIEPDGSVQSIPVTISRYESEYAIVFGNLYQGDLLVSAGVQRLDPNCKVRVWKDLQ
jgi:membrane fusion protein, multidrug efflux system